MAPVAINSSNGHFDHHEVKKEIHASLLSNPFYSPIGEDDKDDSYKYAKYKVGSANVAWS
jgi:sulfonate dioxygenase